MNEVKANVRAVLAALRDGAEPPTRTNGICWAVRRMVPEEQEGEAQDLLSDLFRKAGLDPVYPLHAYVPGHEADMWSGAYQTWPLSGAPSTWMTRRELCALLVNLLDAEELTQSIIPS